VIVENIEHGKLDVVPAVRASTGFAIKEEKILVQVSHQYTHHKVTLRASICRLQNERKPSPENTTGIKGRWLTPREMDNLACPSGVRKVIEYLKTEKPAMFSRNYTC